MERQTLPSICVLPFFSADYTSLTELIWRGKKKRKTLANYNVCYLHHMTVWKETLMYLDTWILLFVRDQTQYHKARCHFCNALLNES